jgi:hypothetical protein
MARYDVKINQGVEGRYVRVSVEGEQLDVKRWSESYVQLNRFYGAAVIHMADNGSGKIYRAEIRRDLERGGY